MLFKRLFFQHKNYLSFTVFAFVMWITQFFSTIFALPNFRRNKTQIFVYLFLLVGHIRILGRSIMAKCPGIRPPLFMWHNGSVNRLFSFIQSAFLPHPKTLILYLFPSQLVDEKGTCLAADPK